MPRGRASPDPNPGNRADPPRPRETSRTGFAGVTPGRRAAPKAPRACLVRIIHVATPVLVKLGDRQPNDVGEESGGALARHQTSYGREPGPRRVQRDYH